MISKNTTVKQSSYYSTKNSRCRKFYSNSQNSGNPYSPKFNSSSILNLDMATQSKLIPKENYFFEGEYNQNQVASLNQGPSQSDLDSSRPETVTQNRICSSKVYVTWPNNISITSKMLSQVFREHGTIIQCYVGKRNKQGQLPSFGFVRFKKLKSAIRIINLKSLVYRNIPFKMDSVIERNRIKFDSYKKNRRRNKLEKKLKRKRDSSHQLPTKSVKNSIVDYRRKKITLEDRSRKKNQIFSISSQLLMKELSLTISTNKRVILAVQQHQQTKNNLLFSRDLRSQSIFMGK